MSNCTSDIRWVGTIRGILRGIITMCILPEKVKMVHLSEIECTVHNEL